MRKGRTSRILLTHTPEMFRNYYGERALARLREQGEVRLHRDERPLAGEALVAAAQGCDVVVSDFKTPGDALVFDARVWHSLSRRISQRRTGSQLRRHLPIRPSHLPVR